MHGSLGSERQSPAPSLPDDRGERTRAEGSGASERADAIATPERDVAREDVLFHFYRGSELLQENRVVEAKEELEYALSMQPEDAKGQDLLAAVCFRLGLYARATELYEALAARFERDVAIQVNLGLAYLKTRQAERARAVLGRAVLVHPGHKRAWGYLGLALQRLGEFEEAQVAFAKGGHAHLAKRVLEGHRSFSPPTSEPSVAPPEAVDSAVREVAETAFHELDLGELRFSLAAPEPSRSEGAFWHTVELGDPRGSRPRTQPFLSRSDSDETRSGAEPNAGQTRFAAAKVPSLASMTNPQSSARTSGFERGARSRSGIPPMAFDLGPERSVELRGSSVALVRTDDQGAREFAGRLDALRAISGAASTRVLYRRTRDADTTEVLGGVGSPIVRVSGSAELLFAARPAHVLALLRLREDLAFVREDSLLGFELRLSYENGRLALEQGAEGARVAKDAVSIVQLRGTGALVFETTGPLSSLPCSPGRSLLVRREWVAGWLGRLITRALSPAESPTGQRGLVSFGGEGTILLCARPS